MLCLLGFLSLTCVFPNFLLALNSAAKIRFLLSSVGVTARVVTVPGSLFVLDPQLPPVSERLGRRFPRLDLTPPPQAGPLRPPSGHSVIYCSVGSFPLTACFAEVELFSQTAQRGFRKLGFI